MWQTIVVNIIKMCLELPPRQKSKSKCASQSQNLFLLSTIKNTKNMTVLPSFEQNVCKENHKKGREYDTCVVYLKCIRLKHYCVVELQMKWYHVKHRETASGTSLL